MPAELLERFENSVVNHATVTSILGHYRAPNAKIHRMVQEGVLIPLKKGLYAVPGSKHTQSLSLSLVANHLCGPSYVSMEYALSGFGIIPERALAVTSVSIRRCNQYLNGLGRFIYACVPERYYPIGVDVAHAEGRCAYMVASKEKALCDWLALTPNIRTYSTKGLRQLLIDDMRMDEEILATFDVDLLGEIKAVGFRSDRLKYLESLIREGF